MLGRALLAAELESDGARGPLVRLLASCWSSVSARNVCRPLVLPSGVRVIGVGGATLGGACKTPFAIALTKALVRRGHEAVFVGHAYRARPRSARVVSPHDDVRDVGDDALFASRRLSASGIDVIVGPRRQDAISFAASRSPCIVVDGLLQTRPEKLARSILLLDGAAPWGSGHCPPAGDLRAPPPTLLRAADAAVAVREASEGRRSPSDVLARIERATHPQGGDVALRDLAGTAVGLILTIARPHRIVETLTRHGVHPVSTAFFADHDIPTAAELDRVTSRAPRRIESWLTTTKCATKLPPFLQGAPVLALEHELELPDILIDWVASREPSELPSSPAHTSW